MAKDESFDITTGCDLQEVDNAVNQALREITGRFDFKGVLAEVEFNRADEKINIHTTDEYKLDAIWQVLIARLISRQVPVKNLKRENVERAGGDTVRQEISLVQSIDSDTAKKITSHIRDLKLKKVKAQQQGDSVRVSSASRDELQAVIRSLKEQDWDVELSFGNYR
ncbi:MAG: YajQ family cyclic di-GMP-binding protein [Dehalococcoidia bacterium]|nr:YajQ family cyclic di-GMP-binding protein [Dehalococcoidia bacterium]MCB9484278.1 YajQ family cyclic di-GMP-binding protein [Dehalococcoidia bacterium]